MTLAWEDRLREAAYTGPDGTRVVFQYEDVSKTIRKKTHAHEFPSVDDTFVQDQGLKGSIYPLRVFFSGEDHDLEALAFEALLEQRGAGTLEHPMYGTVTAIPFGAIVRNDALVTASNQTIFDVTFWQTIAALYPAADANTLALVDAAVADYDTAGAAQFAESIETSAAGQTSAFTADMQRLKDGAVSTLKAAQDGTGKLQAKMQRIDQAINSTLDTLVGGPLTLATQLRQLVTAPARSLQLLRARLDAYGNLVDELIGGTGTGAGGGVGSSVNGTGVIDPGTDAPGAVSEISNRFHANRLTAETMVLGIALAVSGESYRTRGQALDAAKELADRFTEVVDWSELNYAELGDASTGPDAARPNASGVGALDTGEARLVLLTVVETTMSYLIATSFTLGVERVIVLDAPTTAIDLVSRLYGGIDRLDEFIDTNNFTGDQILELQIGDTVRYYAE